MSTRSSLRARILWWLAGFALPLAAAIALHGFFINEYAERLLWDALMQTEFERHLERVENDPDYRWIQSDSLHLYADGSAAPVPEVFRALPDGIHDEWLMEDGSQVLVLLRHVDGVRHAMTLDITEMEREESRLALFILGSAVALVVLIGVLAAFGLRRVLRPLAEMADAIAGLSPDHTGQRVMLDAHASSELEVIANALNDYLQRNARFVERERNFIHTASHELRTPVAVIDGAAEIGLQSVENPVAARRQLLRIRRTARDMEQLISLLLVLAKDPSRLAQASEPVELDQLLPQIIDDHLHLTEGRALELECSPSAPCRIVAPPSIVRAAIGNLLRNAIENSDSGTIHLHLGPDATVTIRDPGHGMSPEQISAIYGRIARGDAMQGDGIGLDLIARLCEQLGWRLDIQSDPRCGTTATLGFAMH